MRRLVCLAACLTSLLACLPAHAQTTDLWLVPPVDGAIAERFAAPERKWGSGHRGIDFAVASGTAVRAAAGGRVAFAGSVAGTLAVTIDHGAFQTTYSALSRVDVAAGQAVDRGHWIGSSGVTHPGGVEGLHLGVKAGDTYLDPSEFLGPLDASAAIHLAPVVDRLETVPRVLRPFPLNVGDHVAECAADRRVDVPSAPPNDNVVIAINGLGSSSNGPTDTHLYRHAVDLLGYPPGRTYLFSYAGTDGARFHRPYDSDDTFGDLTAGATRLEELLERIAEHHPGADVDLVAHSQGGLVARVLLERLAESWSPRLPRVAHLVTLATPHTGAPAADIPARMDDSLGGSLVNDVLSFVARRTGLFPDPRAEAVRQLSPSSELQQVLAREDVAFGTRVLALAVPDDFVVPAHRARLAHEQNLTLPPAGGFAHSRIVESERAASVAYDFLRDAAPDCAGAWDTWGPRAGHVLELVERLLP